MKRVFLNFLIISYLIIIYFAGVPPTNTLNNHLKTTTSNLAYLIGVWPSWSMFAPNPVKLDSKTFVQIKYVDGTEIEKDVEPKITGILSPFRSTRWSKFSQDNLRNEKQKALRPAVAEFFLNQEVAQGKNVAKIILVQRLREVPPLGPNGYVVPIKENYPRVEKSKVLYEMNVNAKEAI
jgi:hypothetical protein